MKTESSEKGEQGESAARGEGGDVGTAVEEEYIDDE